MIWQRIIPLIKKAFKNPLIRVLSSICILAILIGNLPLADLIHTIGQLSPLLWLFVFICFIGGHIIGVVKWSLFINMGTIKLPFSVILRCYFAGLFANLFLPSLAGGDVVRAGLAIRYNGEKETIIFGSLVDRFLDMSSLGLIIIFSALYSPVSFTATDQSILFSLMLTVLLGVIGIVILLALPRLKTIPKPLEKIRQRTATITTQLIRRPQRALCGFALAFIIQSGFVLLNVLLGTACNINLPLHIWFLTWPLAKISAMLPISLGGIGVRETTLALLLERFDIPFSRSVGLGLLWESVLITGGGIGGIYYVLAKKTLTVSELHADTITDGKPQ